MLCKDMSIGTIREDITKCSLVAETVNDALERLGIKSLFLNIDTRADTFKINDSTKIINRDNKHGETQSKIQNDVAKTVCVNNTCKTSVFVFLN